LVISTICSDEGRTAETVRPITVQSRIKQLIVSNRDVIAQTVQKRTSILKLYMTSLCRHGKHDLITVLQSTDIIVHCGNIAGTMGVGTGNILVQSEALKENIGSRI